MSTEDPEFLVLNGAHLKKTATAAELAAAVGVSAETARTELVRFVDQGWAMDLGGRYLVAPDGTARVHERYTELYGALREDPAVLGWYERFETMNDQFIKAVSDWQKNDGDEKALSKIVKVVERLVKALSDMLLKLPRYQNYVRRFTDSVGLIDQGKLDFVCGPTLDSVHTIWFEFHEDILSVIGRPRDV
jgi:hypothetical protein